MRRFTDFFTGTLAGMLIGVAMCAAIAPDAWSVVPTPRPPHRPADSGQAPEKTTERVSPLPLPDDADEGTRAPEPCDNGGAGTSSEPNRLSHGARLASPRTGAVVSGGLGHGTGKRPGVLARSDGACGAMPHLAGRCQREGLWGSSVRGQEPASSPRRLGVDVGQDGGRCRDLSHLRYAEVCGAATPLSWNRIYEPAGPETEGADLFGIASRQLPHGSYPGCPSSGNPGALSGGRTPPPTGEGVQHRPDPRPTPGPAPTPTRRGVALRHRLSGTATWFRSPAGVSAAGPALRAAVGPGWRGQRVTVVGPAGTARTVLGDWMRADKLIDLDDNVFRAVCGPLSKGVCRVSVRW